MIEFPELINGSRTFVYFTAGCVNIPPSIVLLFQVIQISTKEPKIKWFSFYKNVIFKHNFEKNTSKKSKKKQCFRGFVCFQNINNWFGAFKWNNNWRKCESRDILNPPRHILKGYFWALITGKLKLLAMFFGNIIACRSLNLPTTELADTLDTLFLLLTCSYFRSKSGFQLLRTTFLGEQL